MRKGWEYKKLGDCTQILDSQRKPVTKRDRKSGIYPYYGATGIQDYVDKYIFDGRYVLVGEDGAKWSSFTQSAFIIEGKTWVNNHAHVLRTNGFLVDSFLVYFLNYSDLDSYISGAIIRKLTQASLRNIDIPLPPKSTQLAIVSELDKINELIRLKKEQLKDFDNLAQSLFYEMFGDPVENEKGWEVETVQNSCTLKSGDSKANNSKVGTLPYIKVGDMNLPENENYINISTNYVDKKTNIKRIFPIGTIIFPKRGGAILTNKKRLTNVEICCDLNIMGVTPGNMLNKYYLFQYFKILDLSTICSGSTVLQLNNCDINPLRIPLPPLSLQHLFAQRIEQIEREKSEVQKSIQDLETLLASRMQYWFE